MRSLAVFLLLVALVCVHSALQKPRTKPNVPASYRPNDVVNVHLVPHTHDDLGWIKTVDAYFTGRNELLNNKAVTLIIDSVVDSLAKDARRKFIYVEVGFFQRWWRRQSEDRRALVRRLVANGQLEFINGGWCMNDEAVVHYNDIIDNMARGHLWLLREFGVKPRIGWHIDPFGHTAVQPQLFAQMGYDGFFFCRIDYQDAEKRLLEQQMEFMWRTSPSLGKPAELFTGILFLGYAPPMGFDFDVYSSGVEPIQDDPNLDDFNLHERGREFADACYTQAALYRTQHILLTMGGDFAYTSAEKWYQNLDKLISYFNANKTYNLNVFYSTPSLYLEALHNANLTWTVKKDDFVPYADFENSMWSGFFTSRPALKLNAREQSAYLTTCRQLELLGQPGVPVGKSSEMLEDAVATVQHHDAITGTEKQAVANDYVKRLSKGHDQCELVTNGGLAYLTLVKPTTPQPAFSQCPLLNISRCPITTTQQSQPIAMLFYNNLERTRTEIVRLPVPTNTMKVLNGAQQAVPVDFVPNTDGTSPYTIVFSVSVPPFGYSTYFLMTSSASDSHAHLVSSDRQTPRPLLPTQPAKETIKVPQPKLKDEVVENANLRLTFSTSSGHLIAITNKKSAITVGVDQVLAYYEGHPGGLPSLQADGAYIMRPHENTPKFFQTDGKATLTVRRGLLATEIDQVFGPYAKQTMRLYADADYVEIEYVIGPIDLSDKKGKEIITHFTTNMTTQSHFYTDSNAREMKERIINHRDTYTYKVHEPVAGNYVPILSQLALHDQKNGMELGVMVDRSVAGGSVTNQTMELLLHRRLLSDDLKGVFEFLDEPGEDGKGLVVKAKHYLALQPHEASVQFHRFAHERQYRPLVPFFTVTTGIDSWTQTHHLNFSFWSDGLAASWPANVHVLTLQQLSGAPKQILLRVAHMFEVGESSVHSKPVTLSLTNFFLKPLQLTNAVEMALSANQKLSEVHRMSWKTDEVSFGEQQMRSSMRVTDSNDVLITLAPMEIRTYILS